ncbi:hypothetical protein [Baekduia sp. Peel2402]|uniref:hypothetical protein n=1 Tax=Baekduia sp. Peel2402 TaxID=3458296 RepID=UPI00403E5524
MALPTRLPLLAAAAVSAAVLVPSVASAADAPAADCPLWAPQAKVEHAIPGTNLTARDPYHGLLARNRLFFSFSVRGSAADLANVASVSWALDGKVVRTDPTLPFQWSGQSGSSKRMPAGDHQITVTVTPKSGTAASTSFALTATDCQPAGFYAEVPKVRGTATFGFQSAIERGGGPDLDGVTVTATKNVRTVLPRAKRGKSIGSIALIGENGQTIKSYTLKGASTALERGGVTVRFAPGAKRFLRVTGLPAGVKNVTVKLTSGIAALRSPKQAFTATGTLTAGSAHVAIASGGRYF